MCASNINMQQLSGSYKPSSHSTMTMKNTGDDQKINIINNYDIILKSLNPWRPPLPIYL